MPVVHALPSLRLVSQVLRVAVLALAAGGDPAGAIDRELSLAQLHHTAWSTRDGAPAQVESLTQTDDGMLWLGTATECGVIYRHQLSYRST